jgi:LAS superfamily LD-carboxypeptidase LdcB
LKWNYYDYPGGQGRPLLDKNGKPVADKFGNTKEPAGPNEKKARQMIEALKIVNPERRATVEAGRVPVGTAVLCVLCNRDDPHIIIENIGTTPKRTISSELWSWIKGQLVSVQDIGKEYAEKRLNKYAAESFERMREDAKKDGINLVILAGGGAAFREKAASDTGCLAAQNTFAVACFPNSHNLGLAVDLRMSYGNQRYQEATTLGTYGMQNVVDMRQSLVHKWLFLNAAKYNWYPYTHEPWHWEYNPPNFANAFFAGAPK